MLSLKRNCLAPLAVIVALIGLALSGVIVLPTTHAFVPTPAAASVRVCSTSAAAAAAAQVATAKKKTTGARLPTSTSTTQLFSEGRRWNFNEGRSPWGLQKNAEIWNGRLAQMAFVVVFAQELVTGKGVIAGLQEGNPINVAFLGLAVLSTVGLTAWLAIQGTDEYSDEV